MENKSLFEFAPLRRLIKTTPATSFVGLIILIAGFGIIGDMAVVYGKDSTTRTQILTGVFALMGSVAGFYFTAQAIERNARKNQHPDEGPDEM